MNTSAVLMMAVTFLVVTFVAGYFFWKVLRASPKRGQTEPKSDV